MELIMSTLTYKEVDSFLFINIQQNQLMSIQPQELNEYDMDLVSGGKHPAEHLLMPMECGQRRSSSGINIDMREALRHLIT
jgi:hypothetical protein